MAKDTPHTVHPLAQRHLVIGWCGLLCFLLLGLALETFHGLKAGFYLDPQNPTRRLMWTLAHAHGTLFSLLHIAFALSITVLAKPSSKALNRVSSCLSGGLAALPAGFFLGGVWTYGGDPGPGILLVPVGAVLMLVGVGSMVRLLVRNQSA